MRLRIGANDASGLFPLGRWTFLEMLLDAVHRLASGPPEGCDQERLQQAAGEGEVGLEPGDELRAFWNRLQNVAEPGASHGPVPAGVDVDREENVAAESVTIRAGTIKELGLEK